MGRPAAGGHRAEAGAWPWCRGKPPASLWSALSAERDARKVSRKPAAWHALGPNGGRLSSTPSSVKGLASAASRRWPRDRFTRKAPDARAPERCQQRGAGPCPGSPRRRLSRAHGLRGWRGAPRDRGGRTGLMARVRARAGESAEAESRRSGAGGVGTGGERQRAPGRGAAVRGAERAPGPCAQRAPPCPGERACGESKWDGQGHGARRSLCCRLFFSSVPGEWREGAPRLCSRPGQSLQGSHPRWRRSDLRAAETLCCSWTVSPSPALAPTWSGPAAWGGWGKRKRRGRGLRRAREGARGRERWVPLPVPGPSSGPGTGSVFAEPRGAQGSGNGVGGGMRERPSGK